MATLVIRQFDVIDNPSRVTASRAPFIIVLQSHLLYEVSTVIVAPLMRSPPAAPDGRIMLEVIFEGERLVLDMASLANIEGRLLGRTRGSLRTYEDEIRRGLDRLFTGF